MKRGWLLLIIILPVIEVWSIAQMSNWIGGWLTLWLLLAIAVIGIYSIRVFGARSWQAMMQQFANGSPPGYAMLNSICIIVGSVLLIIPGFVSDIIAILLLMPITRPIFKRFMLIWIEKWMRSGRFMMMRR